jgi:CRP-like cAMP-binding protein
MARTGVRRRVHAGETLIEEGRPIESVIFLLQGEFRVSTRTAGEIARLGVGEIVGEMSFVDSAPPSATVTAISECLTLLLDRQAVLRKLESDLAFGSRFYRALAMFLADRLRDTVGHLGYGKVEDLSPTIAKDELDMEILDRVSMAGDRFDRMLKVLAGQD